MAVIAIGKSLKPTFAMLYNPSSQIARKPHIHHAATIGNKVDIEHLFNISIHRSKLSLTQTRSFRPKAAHFAAVVEKSAVAFAVAFFFSPSNPSFRPKAAHLPPQRRNLLFAITTHKIT